MSKILKIFEYGYLIVAIIFIIETVLNWSASGSKAYLYLGFSVLAVFMYFFKRKHRIKNENRIKK